MKKEYNYHYTYRITYIKDRMYYYGVHSCNCLPKEDIGVKYFSSSKNKEFIKDQKENPQDYKYKVLKIFSTRKEAIEHEIFLHKKFNVKLHKQFYNKSNQTSTGFDTAGKEGNKGYFAAKHINTGKIVYISTELYHSSGQYQSLFKGRTHSEETKRLISIKQMGHVSDIKGLTFDEYYGEEKSQELKKKLSIFASSRKGELNGFYGKHHTEDTKKYIGNCSVGMAVYISEEGEKIRLSVDEANKRGLVAESKGRKYSNEVNMKKGRPGLSNANYGKSLPEATKQKIKDSWYESRTKTRCEHCNKMILKNHNRFHFDNCKLKGVTDENKEN